MRAASRFVQPRRQGSNAGSRRCLAPRKLLLRQLTGGLATMQITIELPEDIAVELQSKWKDLPRAALESLALEAYRSRALTAAQLRRLLVFETRMQVDALRNEHEILDYAA